MTSKNSLFKLMIEDFKRRIWAFAISVLFFFFSNLIASIYVIQNANKYMGYNRDIQFDKVAHLQKAVLTVNGADNKLVFFATIVLAILLGISGFYFLFSKKQVDFYHCLPVSRLKIFMVRFLNGFSIYFIPYTLFLCIALFISAVNGVSFSGIIGSIFLTYVTNLIYFVIIYATCMIAVMLTGNLIVSGLATAIFLVYGVIITIVKMTFCDLFFYTYGEFGLENIKWLRLCSIYNYREMLDEINNKSFHSIGIYFFLSLLAAIILVTIAYLLYRYRKSEAATKSMAYPKTKAVIKVLIVIPFAYFIGFLFHNMEDFHSNGWFIFGLIFGTLFIYAIIEIIYNLNFKKAFSHRFQLLLCFCIVFGLFFVGKFDLLNYDGYLPKKNSLKSLMIKIEMNDYHNYYERNKDGKYTYIPEQEYLSNRMNLLNVDGAYEMLETIIKTDAAVDTSKTDSCDMREWYTTIDVCYKKKIGGEINRTYTVLGDSVIDYLDSIYLSEEYKTAVYPIAEQYGNTMFCGYKDNVVKEFNMNADETAKFIEIYMREFTQLSLSDIRETYPIAMFEFFTENNNYRWDTYYIYKEFVDTIEFLKKHGFDATREIQPDEIKHIVFYHYGEYKEQKIYYNTQSQTMENDNKGRYVYSSKEDIKNIMEQVVKNEIFRVKSNLVANQKEYRIDVCFLDEYGNENVYVYMFDENHIPDVIARDFVLD